MAQEHINLLLKDLCGRLPYEVKLEVAEGYDYAEVEILDCYYLDKLKNNSYKIKPYLFPLSSMTEEQYEEFIRISAWNGSIEDIKQGKIYCVGCIGFDWLYDTIDWLNKNHFDYRGLIEKGLAIDATGLGIY